MNIIEALDKEQLRSDIPEFRAGDTVKVYVKVVEGTRERVQLFEGVVISRSGSGVREMFTVRRIVTLPVKLLVSVNVANVVHKGGCKGSPLFCYGGITGTVRSIALGSAGLGRRIALRCERGFSQHLDRFVY